MPFPADETHPNKSEGEESSKDCQELQGYTQNGPLRRISSNRHETNIPGTVDRTLESTLGEKSLFHSLWLMRLLPGSPPKKLSRADEGSNLNRVMNRLKALYRGWGIPCAGTPGLCSALSGRMAEQDQI